MVIWSSAHGIYNISQIATHFILILRRILHISMQRYLIFCHYETDDNIRNRLEFTMYTNARPDIVKMDVCGPMIFATDRLNVIG